MQFSDVLHLLREITGGDHVGETGGGCAIEELERDPGFRMVLPDELEHQQLVEVGVEQGADNGIQLPVVVMPALSEIDDHWLVLSSAGGAQKCKSGVVTGDA